MTQVETTSPTNNLAKTPRVPHLRLVALLGCLAFVSVLALFPNTLYQSAAWKQFINAGAFLMPMEELQRERADRPEPVDLSEFDAVDVVPQQPAITNIVVKPAAEVGKAIKPNELVLGVVVNGEARAYSINTLTGPAREIFNDALGNRAIAATW